METRSALIGARWVHIAARLLMTMLFSLLVAELAGYWLDRLLHSNTIRFLGRGHLMHQFMIHRPREPLRPKALYRDATGNRFSVGNIGRGWLLPSAIVLAIGWTAMIWWHVPRVYQIIAVCTLLTWPIFTFGYLHDRMQEENFWMARVPLLKNWFLKARRLHDHHDRTLNLEGTMDTNVGIGFFVFDRLFGSISKHHRAFNWTGYEIAKKCYLLEEDDADVDDEWEC